MKLTLIFLVLAILIAFVNPSLAETVGQKVGGAIDNSVEFTKEKKEAVQKELQESVDDMDAKIAELRKSAKTATGSLKADMNSQLASLEKDKDAVKQKLSAMKTSTGNAWTELKDGASNALAELKSSWAKAKAKFSEKK